jgi:PAS domain S-box-containing protein
VEFEEYEEGADRWLEFRASPTRDGGVTVCVRDVSDRKRAELDLRRSQDELLDFVENATEGLHWVGPDGTVLWANQAELQLLGYTRDEYIGHSITEFHADSEVIGDILCRLTGGEDLYNYEARLRCKDGSIRHVLINSNVRRFNGQFVHTRCFTRDITERKRAEAELAASEERFVRFMENLPGLAWMKDQEGRYRYLNAAAAQAFGKPQEQVYGKTDTELFPPETAAQFLHHDAQARASAHGILVVETLEHEGGVVHHSLVSKFPVTDAVGSLIGVGGIAIDITERVQAEEALRAADRRKDEFLAMLAHELRNPLAPIITAAEIFRLRGMDDPILQRQRDVIDRQVGQMRRLLDDLLDVSRITRGKIELRREPVDLASILQQALETSRPLFDRRSHTLDVSLPDDGIMVSGDAVRLCQVFTNLLNNAAKYTPPGGRVWLTAERDRDQALIRIRDTGVGMSPEVIAQAFELFAQGDRSLDRSEGGLGLGLTLVRELLERHGGAVTAYSPGQGQGSEFVVTLPLLMDYKTVAPGE